MGRVGQVWANRPQHWSLNLAMNTEAIQTSEFEIPNANSRPLISTSKRGVKDYRGGGDEPRSLQTTVLPDSNSPNVRSPMDQPGGRQRVRATGLS